MQIFFFSTMPFEEPLLKTKRPPNTNFNFFTDRLTLGKAEEIASIDVASVFINDDCGKTVLEVLAAKGLKLVLTRSAGFDHIDLQACKALGISVARVPEYSPYSIAEHSVLLLLALNRRLPLALKNQDNRDFRVDNLMGFDLHSKSVGIVGAGTIGCKFLAIMKGFGCRLFYYDIQPSEEAGKMGAAPLALNDLLAQCDIVSLHCPLNEHTKYMLNDETLNLMKKGSILINTARGGLVDTQALLEVLNLDKGLSLYGADVYEKEKGLFFFNHSELGFNDSLLKQLLEHTKVLITCHQAFLTQEAVHNIVDTTLANLSAFIDGKPGPGTLLNEIKSPLRL